MNKLKSLGTNCILSLIVFCILSLLLVACKTSYATDNDDYVISGSDTAVTITTPEVITHVIDEVPVVYTSIPELSSESSTIIIGKIISTGEIINMARDVDSSKPDPNYFGVGQIYEVEVERYLKGNGEKTIKFVQYQGFLVTGSKTPTTDQIEKAKVETDYIHLSTNQRVLMFLNQSPYEYDEHAKGPLFISVGHPSLFDITDPECVRPLDTLLDIFKYFPPKPLTAFAKQIDEPFDTLRPSNELPYPPPEPLNNCTNNDKSSEPYP
ncbi:MAG: hypothetical protein ABIG63_19595 [Chloroflexota bacterium]